MVFFHPKGSGLILLGGQDVNDVYLGLIPPIGSPPAGGEVCWPLRFPAVRRFSQRSLGRSNELEQCKKKGNVENFFAHPKKVRFGR